MLCHTINRGDINRSTTSTVATLHYWTDLFFADVYHLIHDHSIGDTSPPIPGQLLVQIFITKEEERALSIQEQVTTSWRRQNNIPDSDGFETHLQGSQVDKRNRSDTVSTANSDKHDGKRHKLGYIQE